MRALVTAWIGSVAALILLLTPRRAFAQETEFAVELQGARAQDVVCVLTSIPSRLPGGTERPANAAPSAASLRDLTNAPTVNEFLSSLWNDDPHYRIPENERANDWTWQKPTFDHALVGPNFQCFRDGVPSTPSDARLLVLELAVNAHVLSSGKEVLVLLRSVGLSGNSLRFELAHRYGDSDIPSNSVRQEITVHATGGSYLPVSAVTNGRRATLYLQPSLPEFAFRLPESAGTWSSSAVSVERSPAAGGPIPTSQARVDGGMLRGRAAPGTEFVVEAGREGARRRRLRVRYRVGADDLDVLQATVSWSPPAFLQKLGREAITCPVVTLPDHAAPDHETVCQPEPQVSGQARERCQYTCDVPEGLALPTRLRFSAGNIEWTDTLAWGRFDSSSFASPAPALVRVPSQHETEFRDGYVLLWEDGGRRSSFPLDCPGAYCVHWTSAIPRGTNDNLNLFYRYHGVSRFEPVRLVEEQGAYTLAPPQPKPVFVAVRGGVDAAFRFADGRPAIGVDLGVDLIARTPRFLVILSPEWRVVPRNVETGTEIGAIASSTLAGDVAILGCLPCAGNPLRFLGWLGAEAGVAASYPFFSSDQTKTGEWTATPEAAAIYRMQMSSDGWWGLSLSSGLTDDAEFVTATQSYDRSLALRVTLGLWGYVY